MSNELKIICIGCGNAFSKKNFNQSFVVESNNRRMLIDCGSQVPNALINAGYKLTDIDDIYISHLHADHIGGLEEFAFTRYDWKNKPRSYKTAIVKYAPRLIGNVQLLKDLWDKSLRGGLESMEGFVAKLDTFFEPFEIEPNITFKWEGWTVELIQQIHIMSGSIITPSYGLIFSMEGHKTVYFTTDSQHCSPQQVTDFYKKADIVFQDCELVGMNMKHLEGEEVEGGKWGCYKFSSGVHANYGQLAGYDSANNMKLSKEIKAKMWLSHYQDFYSVDKDMFGNHICWDIRAQIDGFAGFVKVGQVFNV